MTAVRLVLVGACLGACATACAFAGAPEPAAARVPPASTGPRAPSAATTPAAPPGMRRDSSAAASSPEHADSLAAVSDSLPFILRLEQVVVSPAAGPGQLARPAGVAVDAFGRLYVTDRSLHRLLRFDADGRWIGESGALGSGAGALRRPGAVVPAGGLLMAVLDVENRRVVSYDLLGDLQRVMIDLDAPVIADATGHVDPVALAADRGGALYLADADQERLLVFDASGRLMRALGTFGSGPGAFRGLSGVAVSRAGEVFTGERVNARVQRLDASGRARGAWALPVRAGRAALPVAVDDSARVAVADEATGRLWVFDREGRLLASRTGLLSPQALAFGRPGTLWVAEAAGARLSRYSLESRKRDRPAAGEE